MFTTRPLLRRCLLATSCLGLLSPVAAQAQTVVVPARVGQITGISGSVSFEGAGSGGQWIAATPNYPITSGDSLFTQAGAEAAIVLDASRLTLGANTELQITTLDATHFTATESQGEVFLSLADLQPGQIFTVNTPRGAVTMSRDGAYDIAAGDAETPTVVAVLAGAASAGPLQIAAGQEGVLSGTNQTTAQLEPLQRDAFEDHVMAEMMPPPPPYAPPLVQQMTGVDELSAYGSWSQSPDYGAIWYPYVPAGWAPFREGQWAYVPPWGWTWVDMEPWGFAPFHYGRWIDNGGRWGWVPAAAYTPGQAYGPDNQPVYAPAVVGFFGLAAGAALTGSLLASQSIGWVPLAPGEPFYPAYHAGPAYLRRINRSNVRDFNPAVHRELAPRDFVNRQAATYIPAGAMARGSSAAYFGRPMTPDMFGHAHPLGGFNQTLHPDITHHPAPAPHPSAFAARHETPPIAAHGAAQTIRPGMGRPAFHPGAEIRPHEAAPIHPGAEPRPHEVAPPRHEMPPAVTHGAVQPPHPGMAGPAFHPGAEIRPHEATPFHPGAEARPHAAPPPRPPMQNFHQPMPPAYRPHEAPPPRPPVQNFHQPAPAYHPPAEQFHRPAPPPRAAAPHAAAPHAAPPHPAHPGTDDHNHP